MALDEQALRRIAAGLADTLGIEDAMALMEQVSDRPVTKPDLDAALNQLRDEVHADLRAMEVRLNERIDLSSKSVRDELRGANGELRGEMYAAIAGVQTNLTEQTRAFMVAVVASNATIAALAFAAAHLT